MSATGPARAGGPAGEVQRLAALLSYDVLDAPAEAELDHVVRAAAMVTGLPNATLNLIDDHRQHQLTTVGFEAADAPREASMCAQHFLAGEVVHLPDARLDERYRANPHVDGRLSWIRHYAATPLITPTGHPLGTLCVFHDEPGELSSAQLEALAGLGQVVVALFERRRQARLAERYADEARRQAVEALEHATQTRYLAARDTELRLVLAATRDLRPTTSMRRCRSARFSVTSSTWMPL